MSPALQLTTPTPPFPKLVMQKPSPLVASVLWASSDSWASSSCLATSAQTRQVRQCKADLEIAHHHEEEMQLKLESAEQSRYSEASLDLSSSDSPPLSGPLTPPPPPPPNSSLPICRSAETVDTAALEKDLTSAKAAARAADNRLRQNVSSGPRLMDGLL